MAGIPELIVADTGAWRRWLHENHATDDGVWLVLAKKGTSDPTSLTYDEALEDALCFGWIDGQRASRDDTTYLHRFTPRRARSMWSTRNVGIVGRMRTEGRMHAVGEAEVERARADGRWDTAYGGQASSDVPPDLASALSAQPRAQAMFDILTSQNRYAILFRIGGVKQAATRARRIDEFVAMLARGDTVYPQKRRL